ncbi:HET-domain-containing protein [Biscogniauxia marginata]|nr:HET-domain-containing protein [Biscogniauxia marginata]
MLSKSKYKYSPIQARTPPRALPNGRNRIRLLTLLPGVFAEDIVVTLKIAELNAKSPPEYEALSYVWGLEKDPVAITVGRKWASKVSQNLDTALRHLRSEHQPRVLWVDAICINQDDVHERGQQVAIMGDIYRLARRVIVWLGPQADGSTLALDFLDSLGRQVMVNWWDGTMRPAHWAKSKDLWADNEMAISFPSMPKEFAALVSLLERPWFERVWIRQEIYLAKTAVVKCGQREIPWQAFKDAVFCLCEKPVDTSHDLERGELFMSRVGFIRGLCRSRPETLSWVMEGARLAKCGDPKDKVYGVLSMLDPHNPTIGIIPDYTLSTADVYRDLVVRFIAHYNSLDILSFAGLERSVTGLPSWVPDWSIERLDTTLKGYFNAGGYLQPQVTSIENQTLKVTGVSVSRISTLSPAPKELKTLESQMNAIQQGLPSSHKCLDAYGGSAALAEAYCRVLCRDVFSEKMFPSKGWLSFREALTALWAILNDDQGYGTYISDATRRFLEVVTLSKTICTSEQGHIGLVPPSAEVGDVICVLMGCPNAIVLRPVVGQAAYYELVGDAYLDKVMNSEALLGPLPDNHVVTWRCDPTGVYYRPTFLETSTMRFLYNDPRLSRLPVQWPKAENSSWQESKALLAKVTTQMLQERGVQLMDFYLK